MSNLYGYAGFDRVFVGNGDKVPITFTGLTILSYRNNTIL